MKLTKKHLFLMIILFIQNVSIIAQNYIPFRADNGKFGYKDSTGKVVIEPIYGDAGDFDVNGHAVVGIGTLGNRVMYSFDGEKKLIDRAGKSASDSYTEIEYVSKGNIYKTNEGGKYNRDGNISKGKYGALDSTGRLIVKPKYDNITSFNNYFLKVYLDKKMSLIKKSNGQAFLVFYNDDANLGYDEDKKAYYIQENKKGAKKLFFDNEGNIIEF